MGASAWREPHARGDGPAPKASSTPAKTPSSNTSTNQQRTPHDQPADHHQNPHPHQHSPRTQSTRRTPSRPHRQRLPDLKDAHDYNDTKNNRKQQIGPPCGQLRVLPHRHRHRTRHGRSEEHTSELQSRENLVCRLLLEKKKKISID